MEVNFSMLKAICNKPRVKETMYGDFQKYLVLKKLESAIEKLEEARSELNSAVIEAIQMGVEADDIAEDVFFAVTEAFKEDWSINYAKVQ